jgi:hypothetical protein
MYVEHFHSNHVHLRSTQVRSRNSYEIIGIYTENTTELLTGQIQNQPECKLTANCTVSTGKDFYFYWNIGGKHVVYRFNVSDCQSLSVFILLLCTRGINVHK